MIPFLLSSAYVNTFYMVRNLLHTFISNKYLSSYKMDLQIVENPNPVSMCFKMKTNISL